MPIDANEPQSDGPSGSDGDAPLDATGQEIAKTHAAAWHTAGFTGSGVKVGIVDGFDEAAWDAAQSAGEVPAPAGTFCRASGVQCNVWLGGSKHGEGVAEIIHEMAPDAQIYIATAITTPTCRQP